MSCFLVPLRDRCSFGRFPWLISQALSVTYMAGERRLYLERNCRLPESPAHSRRRNREGPASSKGLNSQRGFGPAVEPRRKSRPRSTSLHGSSPCKCQRLSTLRWDRLPPSRPSTKSGARAGGRRLSDRRLHRWLAGTSASAPSSHGAADLLGLNRAHICVRNLFFKQGRGDTSDGYLVAPFDGVHGWYFSNETDSDISITLSLSGFYTIPDPELAPVLGAN